jgi:hypothetical protein
MGRSRRTQEAKLQGRRLLGAAATAAALIVVPAKAQAAVAVTATGDDGNPVALNASAPVGMRMMGQKVAATVDTSEGARWTLAVLDPAGAPATYSSPGCYTTRAIANDSRLVVFHGNGTYSAVVSFYADADTSCTKPLKSTTYQFAIGATVAITPPAGPALTRAANSFSTNTQTLGFTTNPGASSYEIKYAKGGVLGPDGAISGPAGDAYFNSGSGLIELIGLRDPGDYVVVARAKNGDYYTPWSAPVHLRLYSPFDMSSVRAIDARGPSYKLRGTLTDKWGAGGKVTVAIAKGKKGKKFRTMGKAKVNSKGQWTLRFTVRKYGYYRVRYSYSGNALVPKGAVYQVVRIRRIFG